MEKKQNKISVSLTVAFIIVAVVFTFIGTYSFAYLSFSPGESYNGPGADILSQMDYFYQKHYDGEIDLDALERSIIYGYLSGTGDTYANYMTNDEYLSYFGSEDGEKVGIGIQVSAVLDISYIASDNKNYTGGLFITSVVPDSAAEEAGILPGDIIIEAEGEIVGKVGFDKVYNALAGELGDKKELTVLRGVEYTECDTCGSPLIDMSNSSTVTINVVISTLNTKDVTYRMYDENTGIIKITSFLVGSANQFEDAVMNLIDEGAQNIVFDLRDNPGGILDEVVGMLDLLLPKNKLIVTTIDKNNNKTEFFAENEDTINFENYNFAVLVNQNSASAAELFTAALRDYDFATIVGTTTYGKGVAQRTFPILSGGPGYFTVTTEKYNPPSGVNFDGEGVHPTEGYYVELDPGIDLNRVEDKDDNQLQKALRSFR